MAIWYFSSDTVEYEQVFLKLVLAAFLLWHGITWQQKKSCDITNCAILKGSPTLPIEWDRSTTLKRDSKD